MTIETCNPDAWYAEVVCSTRFSEARSKQYELDTVADAGDLYQAATYHAVTDALLAATAKHEKHVSMAWDARRRLALLPDIGAFTTFAASLEGGAELTQYTGADLDKGLNGPVQTNMRLLQLDKTHVGSEAFLEQATSFLRKRSGSLGPENYATTFHCYRIKYLHEGQPILVAGDTSYELVAELRDGFARIARKDKPNFIELTILYQAINHLPEELFPPDFIATIIYHSLEQMPTFNLITAHALLESFSRWNLRGLEEKAAEVLELLLAQMAGINQPKHLVAGLECIAALVRSSGGNAFIAESLKYCIRDPKRLLGVAGDFGKMLDVNEALASIAMSKQISDVHKRELAEVAHQIATKAIKTYQSGLGTLSGGDRENYQRNFKPRVDAIVQAWSRIQHHIKASK